MNVAAFACSAHAHLAGFRAMPTSHSDVLALGSIDAIHVRRVAGAATSVAMISVRPEADEAVVMASNTNEGNGDAGDGAVDAVRSAPPRSMLVIDLYIPYPAVVQGQGCAGEAGRRIRARSGER